MKRNRLWISVLGASVIGLLAVLAGCESAGAGGTSGEADNGNHDTTSAPPEATLELLHDSSVLDGQSSVDYGSVDEGDTVSESFTVRNSGSATANLTGAKVTVAGPYADEFVADTSSTADVIAPGESTTVTVIFTPTGVGALSDESVTLSVVSDAANAPPTIELTFSVINPEDDFVPDVFLLI